ncbi:MAG TPA: hypothetical protein VN651_07460 [Gemmatimonadaceae bacterium]|nr:hypothetical protein [Gemmatimonadaceae bacterium]
MKLLEFTDGDRAFRCEAASSPATPGTTWWWITISGESQRYAAFRTEPGDKPVNLTPRVIAYYTKLLEDRARPREIRTGWGQRRAAPKSEEAAETSKSE